jgi:hypothetical protein
VRRRATVKHSVKHVRRSMLHGAALGNGGDDAAAAMLAAEIEISR